MTAADAPLRMAYFVHDLGDPAVMRRLDMLRPHLADAVVLGFHRGEGPPPRAVAGWPAVPLGRTRDGRLGQRLVAVGLAAARLGVLRGQLRGRTILLSRQVETLPLALAARRRFAPEAPVLQEVLDIHRLQVDGGAAGAALRSVERRLLRRCAGLVVSSPAFVREHLRPLLRDDLPPVVLAENKVLSAEAGATRPSRPAPGPPWRVGWFGVLRCERSLRMLADLARSLPGTVEIDIRGRPVGLVAARLAETVSTAPGLRFGGSYDRRIDLPALYAGVHFAWAVDFYEAGANSEWLLPNRIYEGGVHGAIPLARRGTETARWLEERGAGVIIDAMAGDSLRIFFAGLTAERYAGAVAAIARIPRIDLVDSGEAAAAIAAFAPGLPADARVR